MKTPPYQGPTSKARPRRKPVRSTIGDELRRLRLIQALTPREWSLKQALKDKDLEAFVLWARSRGLSLERAKQAAAEEFADLVQTLRKRYEQGDRTALGEIAAGERPGEPGLLIEEEWYKAAVFQAAFSTKPLPVIGQGRFSSPPSAKQREEIQAAFNQEYRLCKEAKKLMRQRFHNPHTRVRQFAQIFSVSEDGAHALIAEAETSEARAWAIDRVSSRLNFPPEKVRRALLKKPRSDR